MTDADLDSLSAAVSLAVLELDYYRHALIPAYLLANLMSPALWSWRSQKQAYGQDGVLLSPRNRLSQLQRFLHRYTFTSLADTPGGDPWGLLDFADEEKRLGTDFVQSARAEYDETLTKLSKESPESQFGQIINQPYYKHGLFPRLKNETIEVMDAFARVDPAGKGSGKCAALSMLWAAALIIWGRFSPEKVFIMGNQAHVFVFLDEDDGHLLNNGKWFSSTRINNRSELSEIAKVVSSSAKSTFFYNASLGICNCTDARSEISHPSVNRILNAVGGFLSNSLKHPHPDEVEYVSPDSAIPDPLAFDSAEEYRAAIIELARERPGSIYQYALYAHRLLEGTDHKVYRLAAMRDYRTKKLAENIHELTDALAIVRSVKGTDSLFNDSRRIAMPDEVLYFNTGTENDKALLLFTLLRQSTLGGSVEAVDLGSNKSSVLVNGNSIDFLSFSRN